MFLGRHTLPASNSRGENSSKVTHVVTAAQALRCSSRRRTALLARITIDVARASKLGQVSTQSSVKRCSELGMVARVNCTIIGANWRNSILVHGSSSKVLRARARRSVGRTSCQTIDTSDNLAPRSPPGRTTVPSDLPVPISPMPAADISPAMLAAVGPTAFGHLLGADQPDWHCGPPSETFLFRTPRRCPRERTPRVKLKELVCVAIATLRCAACLTSRNPEAVRQGMDANSLDLFDELESADFTDRERAALHYTLAFCINHHPVTTQCRKNSEPSPTMMSLGRCACTSPRSSVSQPVHVVRLIDSHRTLPDYRRHQGKGSPQGRA